MKNVFLALTLGLFAILSSPVFANSPSYECRFSVWYSGGKIPTRMVSNFENEEPIHLNIGSNLFHVQVEAMDGHDQLQLKIEAGDGHAGTLVEMGSERAFLCVKTKTEVAQISCRRK